MRVAVAMSGGTDSTATALMLKKEGHDVVGVHMRLHEHSETSWESARQAAREIAVPLEQTDVRDEFSELVIGPFVEEYARGRTPSPCPVCNRCIKMTLLLRYAASLGCEKIATGHYARVVRGPNGPELLRARDRKKDQSYFLFGLTGEMLQQTLFPLGDFTKAEVRKFLKTEGISAWESAESQELCFIPDGDYRGYLLKRGVRDLPGDIVDCSGRSLGRHAGVSGFTVGQRRGLGICGPEPSYVVRIDYETGTVVVGAKKETYTSVLKIASLNLLVPCRPIPGARFDVKIRSTSKAVACELIRWEGGSCEFRFDRPQSAVAPGQAAVLYSGDRVVGGGWIQDAF